jgi:hypothetical protein
MRRIAVLVFVAAWLAPVTLHAQADTAIYSAPTPRWVAPLSLASANVLLSGITAGITQELKGGSFRDGFTRGALGGLVIYAGKRVAVESFSGAGLIGRQVNAVGTSIVRNAADGVGSLDRLVLPVGVTRVYWQRAPQSTWRVKLDAVALGWTIYGIVESELEMNVEESFSAGTPVFQTRDKIISFGENQHAGGVVEAGVVFLSDVRPWGDPFLQKAYAHERVHTLQMDQVFLNWIEPHDDRLLGLLPGGRTVSRWIDVNASAEIVRLLSRFFDNHGDRPWELEAIFLTR